MNKLEAIPGWTTQPTAERTITGDQTIEPKDGEHLLLVVTGEVTLLEKGSGTFTISLLLKENANVRYHSYSTESAIQRYAYLERDAQLLWVDASYGGVDVSVTSYLAGEGANAEFQSVFLGQNDESYDVKSTMIHMGNHSTSNMRTRSVMLGESKGTYEGLIKIDKDAAGCDAYQKEETLLLSPNATMDATPNLEISNEDVRCSHGVSLSQLDDEKLFYFRARGIREQEAIDLVIHGFFDEVLSYMGEHADAVRSKLLMGATHA